MKKEPQNWEQEFRNTFAEYASHNQLKEPAFIDWATNFIRQEKAKSYKEANERMEKIIK